MNKLLILSAGHGSGDPGACANGQEEHNWNVKICGLVKQYCDGWGMPCDLLPYENGNLVNQINTVNSRYNDLNDGYALQVHLNAGGGTGTEFWVPSHATDVSIAIGTSILNNVVAQVGLPNRGVKDASTNHWGKLGWTDDTVTYAGLIESWFIDVDASTDDRANRVAYGIALGVCKYFGNYTGGMIGEKPPEPPKPPVEPPKPPVEPPKPPVEPPKPPVVPPEPPKPPIVVIKPKFNIFIWVGDLIKSILKIFKKG